MSRCCALSCRSRSMRRARRARLPGCGRGTRAARPRGAVLDREQRRRRRRTHELGILGQRLVDHHRRDGCPSRSTGTHARPGAPRRRSSCPSASRNLPPPDRGSRAASAWSSSASATIARHRSGVGRRRQPLHQRLQRRRREPPGLEQGDQEAERQQHPSDHDPPRQRLERVRVERRGPRRRSWRRSTPAGTAAM